MKLSATLVMGLVLLQSFVAFAQKQAPFIFTLYGGLFFPSHVGFKDTYQSSNDLIWGAGGAIPLSEARWSIIGDLAYFRSEAFLDPAQDSLTHLEEKIIHAGLMNKRRVGESEIFARISVGFNYISIKQTVMSPLSLEQSVEGDKKIGYFGGIGAEEVLGDGHTALFMDILYDYRRSHRKELAGDFGGVRVVVGVQVILF